MIMPFGAGGPTDVFTRAVADELSKSLKQAFVMENRPGAGTIIGTDAAAKSPPDGYTLLMMSATQTTTETLVPSKPFKLMRDFVPVASVMSSELVMVVHPSVGVKTAQEFVALAKAKPGVLNYASSGIGSNYHMAGELFKILTGTDMLHVPYKGSTQAPDPDDVRFGADHGADDPGRTGQRPGDDRQGAVAVAARRADADGDRHPAPGDHLARRHGAGGHAAADRRSAQC
jgi:hypothetical protein